jgi:hypothetical protein
MNGNLYWKTVERNSGAVIPIKTETHRHSKRSRVVDGHPANALKDHKPLPGLNR